MQSFGPDIFNLRTLLVNNIFIFKVISCKNTDLFGKKNENFLQNRIKKTFFSARSITLDFTNTIWLDKSLNIS